MRVARENSSPRALSFRRGLATGNLRLPTAPMLFQFGLSKRMLTMIAYWIYPGGRLTCKNHANRERFCLRYAYALDIMHR